MFEIKIKGIRYIFNSQSISYIILGDESLPSNKSTRVSIVFTNGKVKCFCFEGHKNAERLYNKLLELV